MFFDTFVELCPILILPKAATPATTPVMNQTSTPITTVSAPVKIAKINLVFSIVQEFKDIYSDLNNAETKELSNNITTAVIFFSYEAWMLIAIAVDYGNVVYCNIKKRYHW